MHIRKVLFITLINALDNKNPSTVHDLIRKKILLNLSADRTCFADILARQEVFEKELKTRAYKDRNQNSIPQKTIDHAFLSIAEHIRQKLEDMYLGKDIPALFVSAKTLAQREKNLRSFYPRNLKANDPEKDRIISEAFRKIHIASAHRYIDYCKNKPSLPDQERLELRTKILHLLHGAKQPLTADRRKEIRQATRPIPTQQTALTAQLDKQHG